MLEIFVIFFPSINKSLSIISKHSFCLINSGLRWIKNKQKIKIIIKEHVFSKFSLWKNKCPTQPYLPLFVVLVNLLETKLNYKIEKEVLKETYENNYERISLIITLILGIIGILG